MPRSSKVRFKCEACDRPHRWRRHLAGKRAKCPCGHVMTVPRGPIEPEKQAGKAAETPRTTPDPPDGAWRWWYPVAAGVPIAAFSLYQAIPDFPFLWVCGLMLGAVAIIVGFWSRPASIGGDRA